jgi:plastocyanin
MVRLVSIVGAAALLSSFVVARPMPDSSVNEPGVTSPDGTPITLIDTPSMTMSSEMAKETPKMEESMMGESKMSSEKPMSEGEKMSGEMSKETMKSEGEKMTTAMSAEMSKETMKSEGEKMTMTMSAEMSKETMKEGEMGMKSESSTMSMEMPKYGSGSMSGEMGSGYNDCVQQCVAKFGSPPSKFTPPTETSKSEGGGSGATHTVIVAPSQGVLRYVPFAVNASVGDTIKFMWGANNHTVTKGSALQPCNKTSDALFTSGSRNKDFTFTQVVNDTKPTFFFCNTPGHCQKGMFGIINPPSSFGAPTSVGKEMATMTTSNPDMAAMLSYTNKQTAGNAVANNWGSSIDMASMPEWSKQLVAENAMYTRTFLAANPEVLQADGSIKMDPTSGTPMMIPQDITVAVAAASQSGSSTGTGATGSGSGSSSAGGSEPSSGAATAAGAVAKNGAGSLRSPKVLVGAMAALVAFMAL